MRQISIHELREDLRYHFKNLPVEITKNGQVIGIICTQLDYLGDRGVNPKKITTSNNNTKTTLSTGGRPCMEWINVKDRLPEVSENSCTVTVLVVVFDRVLERTHPGKGVHIETMDFGIDGWIDNCDLVTHWMSIPLTPKT